LGKEDLVRENLVLQIKFWHVSCVIAVPGDLHPDGGGTGLRSRENPGTYYESIVYLSH
jgi:hypothetical protein